MFAVLPEHLQCFFTRRSWVKQRSSLVIQPSWRNYNLFA